MTFAQAQVIDLLGTWQQVGSNAGKCPTCQISIGQTASSFQVTANNGWSATIEIQDAEDVITATGSGRWNLRETISVSGAPFRADFALRGSRLYMTMLIDSGKARRQTVKAVFERPWLGS